jgi:nucleotide-binding universal stress UspA family protein
VATEIAAAAERGKFDLLVLGSKGRSAVKDLLIGSIARRVAEISRVPVLLVK